MWIVAAEVSGRAVERHFVVFRADENALAAHFRGSLEGMTNLLSWIYKSRSQNEGLAR